MLGAGISIVRAFWPGRLPFGANTIGDVFPMLALLRKVGVKVHRSPRVRVNHVQLLSECQLPYLG
jgi:hypothetical protein